MPLYLYQHSRTWGLITIESDEPIRSMYWELVGLVTPVEDKTIPKQGVKFTSGYVPADTPYTIMKTIEPDVNDPVVAKGIVDAEAWEANWTKTEEGSRSPVEKKESSE